MRVALTVAAGISDFSATDRFYIAKRREHPKWSVCPPDGRDTQEAVKDNM